MELASNNIQSRSPIMFLMILYKSIQNRLDELHELGMSYLNHGQQNVAIIQALVEACNFLGLVYKHHLNAKEKVIISALNGKVNNEGHFIVHQSEKDLFDQTFEMINSKKLMNIEIGCQKEFVSLTKTLSQLISQNMVKDEKELFPLLVETCSPKEQATLVWHYLCSIPTCLLVKLLSSLPDSLTAAEHRDLTRCLAVIVPDEKLLQQAIFNWVEGRDSHEFGSKSNNGQADIVKCGTPTRRIESHPIDDILLWHKPIKKELNETFEKIKSMYLSGDFKLQSYYNERMKFISEIRHFQSIAKEMVIFPAVFGDQVPLLFRDKEQSTFDEYWNLIRNEKELYKNSSSEFNSKMCFAFDQIMGNINRQFCIEESEVLPLAREKLSVETQRVLLHQSLITMPLRLIERALPWLVGTMNDIEAKKFLDNMQLPGQESDACLVKLFQSWASNVGKYRGLSEHLARPSSTLASTISCKASISQNPLRIFNGKRLKPNYHQVRDITSPVISCLDQPIDLVFVAHKAARRDLEYLGTESGKIRDGSEDFLHQFIGRFCLLWGLYRAHSNSEDNVIYPAVESKSVLQNVTLSYTLDHEQEERLFEEIFCVLSELSELHTERDSSDRIKKYNDLSDKVRLMCESIRMVVDQHIFREEHELWPLMRSRFSVEEQNKLVSYVLGTTNSDVLRLQLPWVTCALSQDERSKMMGMLKNLTKNTMFEEWLSDSSLTSENNDPESPVFRKGRMIRNDLSQPKRKNLLKTHMTSHWMASQKELPRLSEKLIGRSRSFRDIEEKVFGCKHYKRNCKLRATCCGELVACQFCHDIKSGHCMDRKATTEMMCMQCLEIEPIGPTCNTPSCNEFEMAKYYCSICKLFDDERNIYHCPFCNICRVGRGLGVDYFHCMSCNCCISIRLLDHKCKPKCLETSCPVCDEFLFTSTKPIKALPCGHCIHSTCFKEFESSPYKCSICVESSVIVGDNYGNTNLYNRIEDGKMEASSWESDDSEKSVVVGFAKFWVKRLHPFLQWLGSSILNRGRARKIGKEMCNVVEGKRAKDGLLLCCFVMISLVVFCVMISLAVLLGLKVVGAGKLISEW